VTAADVLVDAQHLTLAYRGRPVLRDATFTVRRGEFWCVLGPNGAGKSTLLRAVLGLEAPAGGTLLRHPEYARRECLGFVPQRCDLNPALPTTVREFVLLGTVGLALSRDDETQRLARALGQVGLHGGARRDYWTLSGGERQRALLARALVRHPTLLLLDEPTTHLDRENEQALLALLASLAGTGRLTPILVTHDERIAARHATHVALLGDGTLTAGPRACVLESRPC
jgi:ABC-type Mn2+/Zn2+ transport system ATPase subunit